MRYFKLFVPITLVFLAIALYQADYLEIPVIRSPLDLLWAYLWVMVAFLAAAACWGKGLSLEKFPVSAACCMAGVGLSVFAKYVPGKVWIIVGRAGYVAGDKKYPLPRLLFLSLKLVLLSIWTGLAMGSIALLLYGTTTRIGVAAAAVWVVMTILVFTSLGERTAVAIGKRFLHRELHMPTLDGRTVIRLMPLTAAQWASWAIGFYFLANGLLDVEVTWAAGMIYPLAAVLGMVAVIVPGGLGIREGILTGLLVMQGIPLVDATTVAVASRLWALTGEVSTFLLGVWAHYIRQKQRQGEGEIDAATAAQERGAPLSDAPTSNTATGTADVE